jgi:hypothetical protein
LLLLAVSRQIPFQWINVKVPFHAGVQLAALESWIFASSCTIAYSGDVDHSFRRHRDRPFRSIAITPRV